MRVILRPIEDWVSVFHLIQRVTTGPVRLIDAKSGAERWTDGPMQLTCVGVHNNTTFADIERDTGKRAFLDPAFPGRDPVVVDVFEPSEALDQLLDGCVIDPPLDELPV